MLILAGVSIATLTGENGILTKANDAKNENERGKIIEATQLAYNKVTIDKRGVVGEATMRDLTIAELIAEGYDIKTITTTTTTITELSVNPEQVEISVDEEDSIVSISYQQGNNSNTKYYIKINEEYYELIIQLGRVTLSREATDVENIETNITTETEVTSSDISEAIIRVVKVGDTITITPIGPGNATITVTNGNISKTVSVIVTEPQLRALKDVVNVGDRVEYELKNANFSITDNTGVSTEQTFNPSSYLGGWEVLSIDENKETIEIISVESIGNLKLKGSIGASRGLLALDAICSNYINTDLAKNSRCIGRDTNFDGILKITDRYDMYSQDGIHKSYEEDFANLNALEANGAPFEYWLGFYGAWGDFAGSGLGVIYSLEGIKLVDEVEHWDVFENPEMGPISNWSMQYPYWVTFYDDETMEELSTPKVREKEVEKGIRPVITLNSDVKIEDGDADGSELKPWRLHK